MEDVLLIVWHFCNQKLNQIFPEGSKDVILVSLGCFKLFVCSTHRDRTFEHVKSLLIMGPNYTKNSSLKCDFLIINHEKYCRNFVLIEKSTKFDQKTVSLLFVKIKSGAHKQLIFYFQMRKYFCRYLHSSSISMVQLPDGVPQSIQYPKVMEQCVIDTNAGKQLSWVTTDV